MKVKLQESFELPSYKLEPPRFGIRHGVEYDCEIRDHPDFGEQVKLSEYDTWFPVNYFHIIEDAPKPTILRGRVETPDEICERWCKHSDPLTAGTNEMNAMQLALHQTTGARLQQIETNKMLLEMINIGMDIADREGFGRAYTKFRDIKKFIQAGVKG